ncbi:hypothetical protein Sinac_7022 [Singulisphaera acidiphila DSM 18658]|uniref:Uncharacterized protein n=1 Tax=Singulisphaera acidiphila (strain ATCC BAA-1392 / DSM 18658 / VKM B-2454 / MOB10) TaxID=886293 RepID=L0DP92_SINAD|nr:hypothetical protein Sinac_7022 [Singulisphaera acidiphila DSM 18658]
MRDGELFEVGRPKHGTDPSESGNMVGLGRLSSRIELLPLLIGPDPNLAEGLTHDAIKGRYRRFSGPALLTLGRGIIGNYHCVLSFLGTYLGAIVNCR